MSEQLIPLTDKNSAVTLPRRRKPCEQDIHVFFEELFPRCVRDKEFSRHPNIVFFNLNFFQFPVHCAADGLIFNSKYLLSCFLYEAALRGASVPPAVDAALPLPLHDFPDGYPSGGSRFDQAELKALADQFYLGHAMRFLKSDPFAMLSIMYHLGRLAREYATKPFVIMLPSSDFPRYQAAIRNMPIPEETLRSFLPTERLDNPSLVSVMRHSRYSLCYDTVAEAFGFYPIESVYLGCPVFTNGCGNVRHLLPPGHGIQVHETVEMYFGTASERVAAYSPVAESVFHAVVGQQGSPACEKGAHFIDESYNLAAFTHRIGQFLPIVVEHARTKGRSPNPPTSRMKPQVSPYVRLADWKSGRFVTDCGNFELAPEISESWERLLVDKEGTVQRSVSAIPAAIAWGT